MSNREVVIEALKMLQQYATYDPRAIPVKNANNPFC